MLEKEDMSTKSFFSDFLLISGHVTIINNIFGLMKQIVPVCLGSQCKKNGLLSVTGIYSFCDSQQCRKDKMLSFS